MIQFKRAVVLLLPLKYIISMALNTIFFSRFVPSNLVPNLARIGSSYNRQRHNIMIIIIIAAS